jgi:hypothetical protein
MLLEKYSYEKQNVGAVIPIAAYPIPEKFGHPLEVPKHDF